MSQLAHFRCVPESAVALIVSMANTPRGRESAKEAFRAIEPRYPDLLDLGWSGQVMLVLIEYLRDECGFDFERIDGHPLALLLLSDGYYAVIEQAEAAALAARFAATPLDEIELRDFANDFSGTDVRNAGKGLLDAAHALAAALERIPAGHVGLLSVD